jgi:glycosyltransferase involved in cell wall biosynthesis
MSAESVNLSLDVVIPVFNGAEWIHSCITKIEEILHREGMNNSRIIVVNDGSTDNTAQILSKSTNPKVLKVHQENRGRMHARTTGALASSAEFILFIDSRVELHTNSLSYVMPFLRSREITTWTCHVDTHTAGNPIARFWAVIELVFWSRYLKEPKLSLITNENFDYYPKGTTALIAPRLLFLEATAACQDQNNISNPKKANDDTSLLRYMVARKPIGISPDYRCTYHARSDVRKFLVHANHRGAVLIDGHWRKGARLRHSISASLILAPSLLILLFFFPTITLTSLAILYLLAFIFLALSGSGIHSAFVFSILLAPFSISYFLGMCHGVLLRIRATIGRLFHIT